MTVLFLTAHVAGNPQQQIEYLKTVRDTGGHISLQKSLDVALTLLRFDRSLAPTIHLSVSKIATCVLISATSPLSFFSRPLRPPLLPAPRPIPSYGSREILLVTGSLSTVDGAGDLVRTMGELRADRVRCSVVSLAAEVHAFRLLAHATGGAFGVALDRPHLARLLAAHIAPLPVDKTQTQTGAGGGARSGTGVGAPIKAPPPRVWIQMGFPLVTTDALSYCTWFVNLLAFIGLLFVCMRVFHFHI
jgi:hypothetical protein